MTPEKPQPQKPEAAAEKPSAILPQLPPLTDEELDELAPLDECCPGCLTHPHNR